MTRLFLILIGAVTLLAVGAFSAIVNPLMGGVTQNLGGTPQPPFHSPVPQPIVDAVLSPIRHATPLTWLIIAAAIGVLMLLQSLNSLIGQRINVLKGQQAEKAELRARARLIIARKHQQAANASSPAAAPPDLKSLLK